MDSELVVDLKYANVIFTRADKGNITVAMDRVDYINKMEKLLKDKETYSIVKNNPIKKVEKDLNTIIKRWHNNDFISKQSYFSLHSSDSIIYFHLCVFEICTRFLCLTPLTEKKCSTYRKPLSLFSYFYLVRDT